jgi:hypothetical protein
MNEWTAGLERGQGNDPHTQVSGSWFTCVPVTPNSDDPFSFNPDTKANAKPTAPSLDHVISKQLSPSGVPMFMRVSGRADSNTSAISYSAPEEMYPGLGTLAQGYNALTGLFDTDDTNQMSPDTYAALRGQAAVDIVREDLLRLEGFDMSAADRMKLEAWKELLYETGSVVASAQCNEDVATNLGVTSNNQSGALGSDISEKVMGDLDTVDVFSNLAVLAAICNANPVIFLKLPGSYVFGGLGLQMESHSLSHRVGDAGMGGTCVDDINDKLETLDRWYAEKFAHLVGQLDSFDEGDGTVLDNSMTIWFNEDSDGNAHNLNNLPILQAGSCGGRFKTGQAINLVDGDPDLSRGNSVGPCDGGGEIGFSEVTSTGTPPEFGNAPINKYFCGIMNALGVKAGADGFPAEGGTQEVTHYGKYDRTEDFVGGGTNPTNITDPGEFTELLANV